MYTSPQIIRRAPERRAVVAILNQFPSELYVTRWEGRPYLKEQLAMDLDGLHWGMSLAEVGALFPDMVFSPNYDGIAVEKWGPPWTGDVSYPYGGCSFDLQTEFYRNQLLSVVLNSTGDVAPCRARLVGEFNARYGTGVEQSPESGGSQWFWYNYALGAVVEVYGQLKIQFYGNSPYGGYDIGSVMRGCNIFAEVLESDMPDGVIAARLPEGAQEVDCRMYPPISLRLYETGLRRLWLTIGADGAVRAIAPIDEHERGRLDAAAERIARQRLEFVPGTRNGENAETIIPLAVYFSLPPRPPAWPPR
jgi:hypothetical protein